MSDEELIQEQLENGIIPDGADADAYHLVFHALRKEPSATLPTDFAERVSYLAFKPKKSFDLDKFFLILGLFGFACVLGYAIGVSDFAVSMGSLRFLANYSYFLIFA